MPALTPLVHSISLDVTEKLVAAGLTYQSLTVTSATNASPIVLGFSAPHKFLFPASVVVAGVGGNAAANGTWYATIVDDTHVALYSISTTGQVVASSGSGTFTSGGTCSSCFVPGGFLIGRVHVEANIDAPLVVFVPKKSRFAARSPTSRAAVSAQNPKAQGAHVAGYSVTVQGSNYSGGDSVVISAPDMAGGVQATATLVVDAAGHVLRVVPAVAGSGYLTAPTVAITTSTGSGFVGTSRLGVTSEQQSELSARALATDWTSFEVHVSSVATTPDYQLDFDAAQAVYQQIVASSWLLCPGQVQWGDGEWISSAQGETQLDLRAQTFVFSLEIMTPVLDQALLFANPQVRGSLSLALQNPDGTTETGWSGTT